jgi:hypothetical protein
VVGGEAVRSALRWWLLGVLVFGGLAVVGQAWAMAPLSGATVGAVITLAGHPGRRPGEARR